MIGPQLECQNCGKRMVEADLKNAFPDIPDLCERVCPGEIVPWGECPDCGALVHEVPPPRSCKICGAIVPEANSRRHLLAHGLVGNWLLDRCVDGLFEGVEKSASPA